MRKVNEIAYIKKMMDCFRTFINSYVSIGEEDWEVFASVIEFREYENHEIILQQGQIEDCIYCICDGVARKYTVQSEKEYTFSFNFPVSFFSSYISFSNQKPSEMSIQAVTKVRLGAIHFDNMKKLYQQAPNASEIGIKMLELAHQVNVEKEISQNTHTAEDNYRQLLKTHPELVQQIPGIYIASYLGITPESLSRIRKRIFQ